MLRIGIPRDNSVIKMTAQPKPVKVHEVGSGKRLRYQLKLKPVALRAEEPAGTDRFWLQFKLVAPSFAAAHFADLL